MRRGSGARAVGQIAILQGGIINPGVDIGRALALRSRRVRCNARRLGCGCFGAARRLRQRRGVNGVQGTVDRQRCRRGLLAPAPANDNETTVPLMLVPILEASLSLGTPHEMKK